MADLRRYVEPGRTLGLIGPSGAGKSSLVNALAGTIVMATQAQCADGRGGHTTTFRPLVPLSLVPLPGGGVVIDTPGVRAAGLIGEGLRSAFADVAGGSWRWASKQEKCSRARP